MLNWTDFLQLEEKKNYFKELKTFIKKEKIKKNILPPDPFYAFKITPYESIKVVIIGQDPYPSKEHAHGLAFSSLSSKVPASLKNIFKELKKHSTSGDLTSWAHQGVFLLNRILTVEEGKPLSHKDMGWEIFTDNVLRFLSQKDFLIFCLWGKKAQEIEPLISKKHLILKAGHPSPLSVKSFLGCNHFSIINNYFDILW